MSDGRYWHSYHIYAEVLDEVVESIYHLMAAHGQPRYFFIRHWNGGRHVRLRVDAGALSRMDSLRKGVDSLGRGFREVDRERGIDYAEAVKNLATLEGVSPREILAQQRPGTVLEIPYIPEVSKYGSGQDLRRCESFFCSASDYTARLLHSPEDSVPRRLSLSLQLMHALLRWSAERDMTIMSAIDTLRSQQSIPPPGRQSHKDASRLARDRVHECYRQGSAGGATRDVEDVPRVARDSSLIQALWQTLDGLSPEPRRVAGLNLVHTSVNRLGLPLEYERYLWGLAMSEANL